jgi:DNA processing protein
VRALLTLLDPRDRGPAARAVLQNWLAFQREFAWRPEAAVEVLDGLEDAASLASRWRGAAPARVAERLAATGGVGVPFPSPLYPARLRELRDPPPLLWVRGSPEALAGPCIALVGSRAPSVYGRHVARSVADALARLGVVIVSGLARGIDGEAHEAALAAGGRTVAFQACGPDLVYPQAHVELAGRIAAGGAVVSELPPGVGPRKPHFPLRNRLISGVSRALIVVEARARSGSLVTARHAADQNVEVLAVPGPIYAPTSEGTNRLLRDGAAPLLEIDDALAAAGIEVRTHPAAAPAPGPVDLPARVREALESAPRDRDELADRLGCAPGDLAAALLELEVAGRVATDPSDGRLRWLGRVPGARSSASRRGLSSSSRSRKPGGES